MRARAAAALMVLAVSLGAQCGDDRFPIALLASQEVHAHCEQATRCGQYATVDTCLSDLEPTDFHVPRLVQRALDPGVIAAVSGGTVRYDEIAARECVDAIAATSCGVAARDVRVDPPACVAMFLGQVAEGGPCAFDQECTSGLCTPAALCPDDYSCCIGTCASPPHTAAIGEACMIDSDCAVDAFCSGSGCHALLATGESCSTSLQCDYDLSCIRPSPTQAGECGPLPGLGEPCPGHACAEIGLVCDAEGM